MNKWKVSGALLLVTALLTNVFVVQSNAATYKRIEGYCLNGSPYTLDLKRDGSKVTETLTIRLLPRSAKWNINYAYTDINQVKNTSAYSDKSGLLTIKDSVLAVNTVNVFIWVDRWKTAVSYCYAGGSI